REECEMPVVAAAGRKPAVGGDGEHTRTLLHGKYTHRSASGKIPERQVRVRVTIVAGRQQVPTIRRDDGARMLELLIPSFQCKTLLRIVQSTHFNLRIVGTADQPFPVGAD